MVCVILQEIKRWINKAGSVISSNQTSKKPINYKQSNKQQPCKFRPPKFQIVLLHYNNLISL